MRTKPISQEQYTRTVDTIYSLVGAQQYHQRDGETAYSTIHGRCCIVNMIGARILETKFNKVLPLIALVEVTVAMEMPHPELGGARYVVGNPHKIDPDYTEIEDGYHVAIVAKDRKGKQWYIDFSAGEVFIAPKCAGDITRPDRRSEYRVGVAPIDSEDGPITALRVDTLPQQVLAFLDRPLSQDLARAGAIWHRSPQLRMRVMTSIDDRGQLAETPFIDGAYWFYAAETTPSNVRYYSQEVV